MDKFFTGGNMLYFVISSITVLIGYLYAKNKLGVIYIKKLLLPAACIVFVLCLVLFSKTAVSAAASGFNLWLEAVVPSLFPFFIASELLKSSGFIKSAGILLEPVMRPLFNIPGSGSFALLMGITSGYPVGAKITTDLYGENLLNEDQAKRLLAFSNNSGPLFIIGAVSIGMFKSPSLGLFLLICHIAAGITVGILFSFLSKKIERNSFNKRLERRQIRKSANGNRGFIRAKDNVFTRFKIEVKSSGSHNLGDMLGNAVANSIQTILMIGGFIMFFSVVITLLRKTGFIASISGILSIVSAPLGIKADLLDAVISGLFEITTGCSLVSALENTPFYLKLMASSFILGWAGLSVHAQVLSIAAGKRLSLKPYLAGKFLQGLIASFYTFVFYKLAGHSIITVFKDSNSKGKTAMAVQWHDYMLYSLLLLTVMFGLYLIFLIAGYFLKRVCIRGSKGF